MRTPRIRLLLGGCVLVLLAATPAASAPSFDLVVSFGGISELAVGQHLACQAFTPSVHRRPGDSFPLPIPLKWRVTPKERARITPTGRLTALEPGFITVYVEDARTLPKGELPAGLPGRGSLTLRSAKELPQKRLPKVSGVPLLNGFSLRWEEHPDGKKRQLYVWLATMDWILRFGCAPPDGKPLPWTLKADPVNRRFYENTYWGPSYGLLDDDWRKALVDAQVTIRSWKDGIARGSLTARTKQKVSFDFTFTARLADPLGTLRRAAMETGPKKAR